MLFDLNLERYKGLKCNQMTFISLHWRFDWCQRSWLWFRHAFGV